MKLYFSPGACSLAPHILLRETGLEFTLERVDLRTHTFGPGNDYYTVNPAGQVPVLELPTGERLTQGPVIAQYICDQGEDRGLMPSPGMARYRVMEWQNYVTSELHKSFTPLFNPAFDDATKQTLSNLLREKFERIDAHLRGVEHLTGPAFTAADAYLFTVTNWAGHVALDLSDLPHLQAYRQRVAGRPAVQAALKAEGLPA